MTPQGMNVFYPTMRRCNICHDRLNPASDNPFTCWEHDFEEKQDKEALQMLSDMATIRIHFSSHLYDAQ